MKMDEHESPVCGSGGEKREERIRSLVPHGVFARRRMMKHVQL